MSRGSKSPSLFTPTFSLPQARVATTSSWQNIKCVKCQAQKCFWEATKSLRVDVIIIDVDDVENCVALYNKARIGPGSAARSAPQKFTPEVN